MPIPSKLVGVLMIFSVRMPALAQNQGVPSANTGPLINFDVISLKPYTSSGPVMAGEYSASRVAASNLRGGPGTSNPEHITATGITLQRLVAAAYGVLSDQVSGPGWINE